MLNLKQNIFSLLLDLLSVKHTKKNSDKYYEEHIHKNSLYGLSKMLSSYGIANMAMRLEKDIFLLKEIETPFVAHVNQDFAIIDNINSDHVSYYWRSKKNIVSYAKFIESWSGIILSIEVDEDSIEPNYKENRKKELFSNIKKILFFSILVVFFLMMSVFTQLYNQITYWLLLLFNGIGVYVSCLLLYKQLNIDSSYIDKICSLFVKETTCHDVLKSNYSYFFNIISWSELGLSYFVANIILIVGFPSLYQVVALFNICTLPYTIWSFYSQKWIIKKWCPLCLIIQFVLWSLFIIDYFYNLFGWQNITFYNVLIATCIYILSVLIVSFCASHVSEFIVAQKNIYALNKFKYDEDGFIEMLKKEYRYSVDRKNVGIVWGNPDAKNLITIVTNPHCNPCSMMHARLQEVLNMTNNGYCIQYILMSFDKSYDLSVKLLISMYQQLDSISFSLFLNDWYDNGKDNPNVLYDKYLNFKESDNLIEEFKKQKQWIEDSNITVTPTILLNGYKLPDKYVIEDLIKFQDIDVL